MSKTLNPTQTAGIALNTVNACYLLDITIGLEEINFTDAPKAINVNEKVYAALGTFLSFDSIEEVFDLTTNEIAISLSGVSDEILVLFRREVQDLINRPIRIYRAFVNDTWESTTDPLLIFEGFITKAISNFLIDPENGDGSNTIKISCANLLTFFGRINLLRTNNNEHQARFPGDLFFNLIQDLSTRDIKWVQ